ncbi:hypothetical protein BJ165DRAFT_653110 [Panaeolus papilionaceus]|nr:hypothetical protein BJ165DRAFT_653110 [Panaeolus papilionaceus]
MPSWVSWQRQPPLQFKSYPYNKKGVCEIYLETAYEDQAPFLHKSYHKITKSFHRTKKHFKREYKTQPFHFIVQVHCINLKLKGEGIVRSLNVKRGSKKEWMMNEKAWISQRVRKRREGNRGIFILQIQNVSKKRLVMIVKDSAHFNCKPSPSSH